LSAISADATEQVFKQEGGGFLVLLTISHATLVDPIRVVNNTVDVVSNGDTYTAFPFKVKLPNDRADDAPAATLQIDNVSRELQVLVRSITTPPTVQIDVVRMDDFDTIEMSLPPFKLRNVEWDITTMFGDLKIDNIASEPFPQRSFTPSEYPAIF
jgi:hypothetical protein